MIYFLTTLYTLKICPNEYDISKDTLQMQKKVKKPTFLQKHVSLSCLHFSLMFSEGEVKSPYFLQVDLGFNIHLKFRQYQFAEVCSDTFVSTN
jgi:hypothetical protein